MAPVDVIQKVGYEPRRRVAHVVLRGYHDSVSRVILNLRIGIPTPSEVEGEESLPTTALWG